MEVPQDLLLAFFDFSFLFNNGLILSLQFFLFGLIVEVAFEVLFFQYQELVIVRLLLDPLF